MRVRDMRVGQRVMVRALAPGSLEDLQGQPGTIRAIAGRLARVAFDHFAPLDIDAQYLVAKIEREPAPEPADSPELVAFKLRVAQVARRLATEHNMCDVIDEGLRELGIEPIPAGDVLITLRIPEEEFSGYREEHRTFEEDVITYLDDVLLHGTRSDLESWFVNIEFVDKKED